MPLNNGDAYQLLFTGRSGGSAGPDVRDAVLCSVMDVGAQGRKRVGDVEFHVRSSDWVAHQHHTDPRYNNVILHVVLVCDDPCPTLRQDGQLVPVCSLYDLPSSLPTQASATHAQTTWPCQHVMQCLNDDERSALLRRAGLLRFEQKTQAFVEQLRVAQPTGSFDAHDVCLIPALAEGLGYGRDRDFFRAAGLSLLGIARKVPEPLGHSSDPSPLDAGRLHVLRLLVERWCPPGVWQTLRAIFNEQYPDLTQAFKQLGLSPARAAILLCNVVLPFAAAVALPEQDARLVECARELYVTHPGLSSNRVTRMMCTQLQLKNEPRNSCQQQGLHYIYQQTCREKRCEACIVGKRAL